MHGGWQPVSRSRTSSWQRLGWPLVLGCGLLALAWLLNGWVTPQWRASAEWARREALQAGPAAALQRADAVPVLPARQMFDERLDQVLVLARESGMQVTGVSQDAGPASPSTPPAEAFVWDRVTLRLEGDYAGVRRFVQALLQADPALAVESLRLSRAEGVGAALRAELALALARRAAEGAR